MKTINTKWNLRYLWPKRDIACLDMEDWPVSTLKRLSVGKPEYPSHVTDDMILDSEYIADNLVIDERYVVDDDMVLNDCRDKNYPEQNVKPLTLQDFVKMRDEFKEDESMQRWADELDAVINQYN